MNNQITLDQHRAIFLATIDFILQRATGRVIADNHDTFAEYFENFRLKGEKQYQAGNLKGLQRVMQELNVMPQLARDEIYITFMKDRTGYNEETIKQIIPATLPDKNKGVINPSDVTHKMLAEVYSPDNKRKIIFRETTMPNQPVTTYLDLQFERSGGSSVYIVEGANLDINVYWKDNNTVIIETRKEYVAKSKHADQYQSFDDVVKVEYVTKPPAIQS